MDLFTDIVRDAGIPTEQEELNAAFRQLAVDERVTFNNDSSFSPFWRLVTALVTKPVLWLLGLLTNEVLPNLFLKTAKGKWVDLYVWSLDLERKRASKALGELVLHRYDDIGELEVSAGTVIQTVPISGKVYRVLVKDDAVFEAGKKTLHIIVEAEEAGTAYNVGNGLYSVVVDNGLSGLIERVSAVDWLLVPGADEETDDDLKLRGRNQFTAVNRWHIDSTYRAMISKFQGISVDDIYFQHDAPRGPGTANAYILFDADTPNSEYLEKINSYINEQDNHGFGDDLQCFVMSTYLIDNDLKIWLLANVNNENEIKKNVLNFIKTAFRELSASDYKPTLVYPNKRFSWSKLIQEIHREFPEIEDMDFEFDDALISKMNVPKINSMTVTIQ